MIFLYVPFGGIGHKADQGQRFIKFFLSRSADTAQNYLLAEPTIGELSPQSIFAILTEMSLKIIC